MSLELGGSRSPKNAEGVRGRSWKNSEMFLERKTGRPLTGGGSETGEQESPSTSDIELEYDVILPDKGNGKAVPDNTAQGGSGHDPPRERERMSHLSR